MNSSTKIAFAEVDKIISLMEIKYIEKIPKELLYIFNTQKDQNHMKEIDVNKPLVEQNINKEALAILAILNYKYWCETEEERKELVMSFSENEFKHQREMNTKYNPDNLFKAEQERFEKIVEETKIEMSLAEQKKKETFILKIINKIKKFLKK